jgi:16S rRNA (uracil1498-N3)-methyltransferase
VAHRFRFFGEQRGDGLWDLSEDEARHAAKILRLDVGAEVEVTNGRGDWALGTIDELKGARGVVRATEERRDPEPPYELTVAVGALKPGDLDEVLPGLAELGVDRVRVFGQEGAAKARLADKAQARWARILEQAIKQCKRSRLPPVEVFGSVTEMTTATGQAQARRIVLLPGADATLGEALGLGRAAMSVDLVIGGEHGFSADETQVLASAGYRAAALGSHVLRAQTAVIAAAAVAAEHRLRCGCV